MVRNRPRQSSPRRSLPVPTLVLSSVLLVSGGAAGWFARGYIGDLPDTHALSAAVLSNAGGGIHAPECPVSATETNTLELSDTPITGEGVIEFRFYRPGQPDSSRKWVARITLPPVDSNQGVDSSRTPDQIGQLIESEGVQGESTEQHRTVDNRAALEAAKPAKTESSPVAEQAVAKPAAAVAEPKITTSIGKSNEKKNTVAVTYTLQVSAHQDRGQAETQVSKLEMAGFDGRIEKAAVAGKGVWYRVRIGRRLSRERADQIAGALQQQLHLQASIMREE